ncbi:MAG: hypothetical protein AABY32_01155 [Nanoarchaeota archaeon]
MDIINENKINEIWMVIGKYKQLIDCWKEISEETEDHEKASYYDGKISTAESFISDLKDILKENKDIEEILCDE